MKFLAKIFSFVTVLFGIGVFLYILKKLNKKNNSEKSNTGSENDILIDSFDTVDSDNYIDIEEIKYNDFNLDDTINADANIDKSL